MSNTIKNILANVNINASYDTDSDDYFREEALELPTDSDPFLCVMLSGMSPKTVFEDCDFADEDLMFYILSPQEVAQKLQKGIKLKPQGEYTRVMVNSIREYYTSRLIEEKLTSRVRSNPEFSKDLMQALNIRGSIQPEYAGFYNKLWDMYDSDLAWDMFVSNCKSASQNHSRLDTKTVDLKFYTSVHGVSNKSLKNKKLNYTRYFFVDRKKYLYEHSVLTNNPVRPFLENYFQTFSEISRPWKSVKISLKLSQSPVPVYRDDFNYYKITDWAGLNNNQGEYHGDTTT